MSVDFFSDSFNVYSKDFAIRFIPSYLIVSVLAFLVEHSSAASRNALLDKQQLLAGTINELQEKEKELEEARNQLELRVTLREQQNLRRPTNIYELKLKNENGPNRNVYGWSRN